jgi:hypothetical protein
MSKDNPNVPQPTEKVRPGRAIVADFIQEMKAVDGLDLPTVEAIRALFEGNKLTWTNLLNALDEARDKANA